ncbi:MAG: hypothetical protein P4K93_07975, partial [Terracidiphilus sp.]|nr:hypothetical protein [Terracidiphilus sp.]
MRWFGMWLLRGLIGFAAFSLVVFAVDWTVFVLRGSPHSTVAVSRFMMVPLKGQKTEYDYLGTANVSCAVALFPQGGQDPCWHLKRNP